MSKKSVMMAGAAAVFYVALAVAVTWPFALHPSSTTIAPVGGDIDSSIAKFQALSLGHLDPFLVTHAPAISYPVGPVENTGVDRVSFFSTLWLWVGTHVFGAITAHSLMSFFGIVLSAFMMFLFVWRVTKSALAGTVGGLVFGFCTTMYILIGSDMTYTWMWLDLLPLWAFWELAAGGYSRRRALIAMASVVPGVFWTPYYMLHVMVMGGTCLAVAAWYVRRERGWRTAGGLVVVTGVAWAGLLFLYRYVGLHSPSSEVPVRTLAQIYQQSAQPLMYVLPGAFSWGAQGGGGANSLLVHLVPRARGLDLYVGLSTLALAVTGLARLRPAERKAKLAVGARGAAVFASWGVVVCGLFSLPPTYKFGPVTVPLPGDVVAHVVPALRAGQRFVMPIEACLGVLAGIGAWLILRRVPERWRLVVTAGILVVAGLDLWALPQNDVTHIATYPSLVQLAAMPTGPVAWYQEDSLAGGFEHIPCLLQHEFKKPLINDCALGRSPQLGVMLTMPLCEQITALQAMGTRYVVLAQSRDAAVRDCLAGSGIEQGIVAHDPTYEVVTLNMLSANSRAVTAARLGLP